MHSFVEVLSLLAARLVRVFTLIGAAIPALAAPPNATVVEFYRSDIDHYFITASPFEQAVLDEGMYGGWTRTGRTFLAWTDPALAPPTARPVCRFLGRARLDSHFHTAFENECSYVSQRLADAWLLESSGAFFVEAPDTSGSCPDGTDPVYRVYNNNRADANHRYVTALDDRTQMLSRGWIAEGYGAIGVALCVPRPLTSASDVAYADPTTYSPTPGASLAFADEAEAVSHHTITLQGTQIPYTATAGHLVARDPQSLQAQASMFYVAYAAQGRDAATRPITFFFNGGPGSATVWLHLGSYGPKRLATGGPSVALQRPYALVHNDESLLDATDMVFVDAVGAGLSQAIAPFNNQAWWSVEQDARIFRNFIVRYLERYGRGASPKFIFGESYGGVRAAVLANLLETAGVTLSGVVFQSPVLDYNANCGVTNATISCAGYLPTYAAVGTHYGLVDRGSLDQGAFLAEVRTFAIDAYDPAIQNFLAASTLPEASVLEVLVRATGLVQSEWESRFNYDPGTFQRRLVPNTVLGRYDARVSARVGNPLASGGDPSSNLIASSFIGAIQPHLAALKYSYASPYITLGNAIQTWDFSYAGRVLPDTVPDLAAALAQNPQLVVLSLSGYHDLATPFFVTERDLARLGPLPNVTVRNYDGGHMTYLDDNSRRLGRGDLIAMYRRSLIALATGTGNQ